MITIYEVYYPDLSGDITDSFWFNEDLAEYRRRELSKPSMYYQIAEWEVVDSEGLTLWKPSTMEEVFNMTKEKAVSIVEVAIEAAESGEVLSEHAMAIKGMTSRKIKLFLNEICCNVDTYFEVGLYKGATFISAIEDNSHLYAVGCDNWSQFGGPKKEFNKNMAERMPGPPVTIIDGDCFSPEVKSKVNVPIEVMFYDGDHSYESQYKAFHLFTTLMSDVAILIVDDWNKWGKRPTLEALNDSTVELIKMWELDGGWWEGVGVLVLERSTESKYSKTLYQKALQAKILADIRNDTSEIVKKAVV